MASLLTCDVLHTSVLAPQMLSARASITYKGAKHEFEVDQCAKTTLVLSAYFTFTKCWMPYLVFAVS